MANDSGDTSLPDYEKKNPEPHERSQNETPTNGKAHSYLRRLDAAAYRGIAEVHWSLTIDQRKCGWLDREVHLHFRELLVHTSFRYGICCPMYCLMPDHMHLLWVGWRENADQRVAMKFFRSQINRLLLKPRVCVLQKQGYDRVLRGQQRSPDGLGDVAAYIRANPVRAGLCDDSKDYRFAGCVMPGYPELDIDADDYWPRFWRIYWKLRDDDDSSASPL
ncbi:MAG: hypothetical protein R3F19_00470 [Verrucomicrobiales bacterium]